MCLKMGETLCIKLISGLFTFISFHYAVTQNPLGEPLGAPCKDPSSVILPPADLCDGKNTLCLQRTKTSRDYTCQCDANYYDDNGNQTAGQCRPISELAVDNITFTSITTTSMRVFWSPPLNHSSFISGYVVEWSRKDNKTGGSTSMFLVDTDFDITSDVVSGTAYVVKITSLNFVNYSDTEKSTFSQKEQALKPEKPGPIINASSDLDARDYSIKIVWTRPSGSVYQYKFRLYDSERQYIKVTIPSSSLSISSSQLRNGHRYNVSIVALSQEYGGEFVVPSEEHIEQIKTIVQRPSSPRSVQCHTTTDQSVTIRWQEPLTPNGDLKDYSIATFRYNPDGQGYFVDLESTGDLDTQYEITGLDPGTYYYFNVYAINEQYSSFLTRLSEPYCLTKTRMSEAPNKLSVYSVKSRNFSASWTKPTDTYGENLGYVVQVRLLDDTCVKQLIMKCTGCQESMNANTLRNMCEHSVSTTELVPKQTIMSSTRISQIFEDLSPYVYYNVIITAVNTEGRGRIANKSLQTDEEVPQKPTDLTISYLTATSCTLTWNIDDPRPGDTYYTVIVDAVSPVIHDDKNLMGFYNRTQDIIALQENWNYTVTIKAETSKGGVYSDPKTFRTLGAAPGPVDNFKVILHPNNNIRKIVVEWKIPVLLERNSDIDRFVLYHNTSEDLNVRMISFPRIEDESFTYIHTFNVTPEKYYQFKIYAVNTENQNGIETERTVLAPDKVSKEEGTQETSDKIFIAIGVAVPIFAIAVIATVVIVIYRRRSNQNNNSETLADTEFTNPNLQRKAATTQSFELTNDMSNKQVNDWLKANNLDRCRVHFKGYTGQDILILSKDDMERICGAADGIRMYNRLQDSTTEYTTPLPDEAYMDLENENRNGIPYQNIELYASLQNI